MMRNRLTIVALVLALVVTALTPGTSASADLLLPTPDPAELASTALPAGADIGQSVTLVQGVLGNRFSGAWVTATPLAATLTVAVVDPLPSDESVLGPIALPLGLVVVGATYSKAQLDDFQTLVADAVIDFSNPPSSSSISVDAPSNRVSVLLGVENENLLTALRASVPADALNVTVDTTFNPAAADSRETYPPYKGGRRVKDMGAQFIGNCTSGFEFTSSFGFEQGTTAGHCATSGNTQVRTGSGNSKLVGITNTNTFRTFESTRIARSDAVFIGLSDQSAATNKIFINRNLTRNVTEK